MATRNAITNSLLLKSSRFVKGGTTEIQDKRLEWWERNIFPQEESDIIYTVENFYAQRLDLISSVFYNDSKYWWFIAQYNNILDPFTEIMPGVVLLIPTPARMSTLLTGQLGGIDSKREDLPMITPVVV